MNFNRVLIAGRLATNPELKHTSNGTPYVVFRVAYNQVYRKNGEWQSKAHFFPIISWANPEKVVETLNKGDRVFIDGELEQHSYTDKEGNKRSVVRIRAFRVIKIDKTIEDAPEVPELEEVEDDVGREID